MSAHEYAFDVILSAVVRVHSETEGTARASIAGALDAAALNAVFHYGNDELKVTEVSVVLGDSNEPYLFEVDDVPFE